MLNKNFISSGKNKRIEMDIQPYEFLPGEGVLVELTPTTVLNYSDIDWDKFYYSLYLNKTIILTDAECNPNTLKVTNIEKNDSRITITSVQQLSFNLKYIFSSELEISSGTYDKDVRIKSLYEYAQQYTDNQLKFKVSIKLDKPKFANVYKYTIKYRNDFECWEELIVEKSDKDFNKNDIINLTFDYDTFDVFYYKISANYSYKKIHDISFYTPINTIKRIDII